jgi:hypothetical protein
MFGQDGGTTGTDRRDARSHVAGPPRFRRMPAGRD